MLKKLLKIRYNIDWKNIDYVESNEKKTLADYLPSVFNEREKINVLKADQKTKEKYEQAAKRAPEEEVNFTEEKISILNNLEEGEVKEVAETFKGRINEFSWEIKIYQINKVIEKLPNDLVWNTQTALLNTLKKQLEDEKHTNNIDGKEWE